MIGIEPRYFILSDDCRLRNCGKYFPHLRKIKIHPVKSHEELNSRLRNFGKVTFSASPLDNNPDYLYRRMRSVGLLLVTRKVAFSQSDEDSKYRAAFHWLRMLDEYLFLGLPLE